jgi:isopenicillin N synthase-like dioxygenase
MRTSLISRPFQASVDVPTDLKTASVLAELLREGRAFFEGPRSERESVGCLPKTVTGWRPIGVEYSQSPDRPDMNETFCFRASDDTGGLVESALMKACRAAQRVLDAVSTSVLSSIAVEMGLDVPVVTTNFESWLQMNWSRPAAVKREFIQEPHEDGHLITLLMADARGLEVLEEETGWRGVLPSPENLICFPGECGALLTADAIRPTMHRVVAHPDVESRLSVAYFVNPNLDQVLNPWVDSPRNAGVDLLLWGQQNPARFGLPTL